MNILLVLPKITKDNERWYNFPIGIAYISSSLKKYGKHVFNLNLNYKEQSTYELIANAIEEYNIDMIGTGGLSTQYQQIFEIISSAKKVNPNIITAVGGGIITSDPETAMIALQHADIGMIGEGEITICELCDALENNTDLAMVEGIIYKNEQGYPITPLRKEIEDLDSLPFPDYDGFEFDQLIEKQPDSINPFNDSGVIQIVSSRSCPYRCTFCFHSSGKKYRQRSLDNVFQEIDWLIENYTVKYIFILDELFANNRARVIEFCQRIKKYHIPWVSSLRVDIMTEELAYLLKDSNCARIGFGLESFADNVLISMKKHISSVQIENAMKVAFNAGLKASGIFIFGDIAETMETANRTFEFWKSHPEYEIALSLIRVYPGSYLYQYACEKGLIKDKVAFIKNGCPAVNVSQLSDSELADVAARIDELSLVQQGAFDQVTVTNNDRGYVDFEFICSQCGTVNAVNKLEAFRRVTCSCHNCHASFNISASEFLDDSFELNVQKLVSKQIKAAIWPRTASLYNMIQKAPSLLADNFYFIDKSLTKQLSRLMGKVTFSPEIIHAEKIEVVFIAIETQVATEIESEIAASFPEVKQIIRMGRLTMPNFKLNLTSR